MKPYNEDIYVDLGNAFNCSFGHLLQYFLSLCLQGKSKKILESFQSKIEVIQNTRSQDARANNLGDGKPIRITSEEETNLVDERDKLLEDIFQTCLNIVLDVANDPKVRQLLHNFSNSLNLAETERYAPYSEFCNYALGQLRGLKGLPLRPEPEDSLRTSFACLIPNPANTQEMSLKSGPYLIRTSQTIADSISNCMSDINLVWSKVLSCDEIKASSSLLNDEAAVSAQQLTSIQAVGETADKIAPSSSKNCGSKRSRVDSAGSDDRSSERIRKFSCDSNSSETSRTEPRFSAEVAQNCVKMAGERQLAAYALEMLSYGIGVHHVINTLIVDEHLWIWYYDRQGIIQSSSISVIADFPRFLVLLLTFQRFTVEDWGIVPCLNAEALNNLGLGGRLAPLPEDNSANDQHDIVRLALEGDHFSNFYIDELKRPQEGPIVINIHQQEPLTHRSHDIVSRATSVFRAECGGVRLVCKIYHPEAQRSHEGEVLRLSREIATKKSASMLKHLPTLYFYGDLRRCSTMRVRSMVKLPVKDHRTLRILVLPELQDLETQCGDSFVNAWLDAVKCHAFLWKHGVEHGDPSLWNIMYNPIDKCGILMDFDLSVIQWLPRVPGTSPTGTIPFMATILLKQEYWDGKVNRHYHHELEAFFWILPFVFLTYSNGKRNPKVTVISNWITSDITTCRCRKVTFHRDYVKHVRNVQPGFQGYRHLLLGVFDVMRSLQRKQEDREGALFRADLPLRQEIQVQKQDSKYLWTAFISNLEEYHSLLPSLNLLSFVEEFKKHNPVHNNEADRTVLFDEVKKIYEGVFVRQ